MRSDIPIGNRFAQVIHAAALSAKDKVTFDTHAVALSSPNQLDLLRLELILTQAGIDFVSFREPDWNNELMAIGIVPCEKSRVKKYISKYKLIKEV